MTRADSNLTAPTSVLSDSDWAAVENTLPAGADRERARRELGRIKRDWPPQERVKECEECAQLCKAFNRVLPHLELIENQPALADQLVRQIRELDEQAKFFRRVLKESQGQPKFSQHCDALWLWQRLGGDFKITTPRKLQSEAEWPDPKGPVVDFLKAAAVPVFGNDKPLSARQCKRIVHGYLKLQYSDATLSSTSEVRVDDSKVFVVNKDGKIVG